MPTTDSRDAMAFVIGHVTAVIGISMLEAYAEQFCNFWRFLFSGRWYASFRRARPES